MWRQSPRGGMHVVVFNGAPTLRSYDWLSNVTTGALVSHTLHHHPSPLHSHGSMSGRCGTGIQPTEEDYERRRRLDASSVAHCKSHNQTLRVLRLQQKAARAIAPPPPTRLTTVVW